MTTCPGPRPPSYVCARVHGDPCELAVDADVVVLDLWLASDWPPTRRSLLDAVHRRLPGSRTHAMRQHHP